MSPKIAAVDLLPTTWDLMADTTDDIRFWGKVTIRGIIHRWCDESDRLDKRIEESLEKLTRQDLVCDDRDVGTMVCRVRNSISWRRKIQQLYQLEHEADEKPALPSKRPYDWFRHGDRLVRYAEKHQTELIKPIRFATCSTYAPGYKKGAIFDQQVTVRYDERLHDGDFLNGRGGAIGTGRPEVMHQWEFDYLLAHPEFARLYAEHAVQASHQVAESFNAEDFLAALERERRCASA